MAKIELTLTSTRVDDDYGIVDVYFNGEKVQENLQLSNEGITFSHNITPVNGECTVRVDLLNDKATDYNNDGIWDEVMDVRITSAKYAHDDVLFVPMIPHNGITIRDAEGTIIKEIPPAEYLSCYGEKYSRTFPTSRYIPQ